MFNFCIKEIIPPIILITVPTKIFPDIIEKSFLIKKEYTVNEKTAIKVNNTANITVSAVNLITYLQIVYEEQIANKNNIK